MPDMSLQVDSLFKTAMLYSDLASQYLNVNINPKFFVDNAVDCLELSSKNNHKNVIVNSMHEAFISLMLQDLDECGKVLNFNNFYKNDKIVSLEDYKNFIKFLEKQNFSTDLNILQNEPGTSYNNALLRLVRVASLDTASLYYEVCEFWDSITRIRTLDETISFWSLKGFDALKATWAVITLECQNHINLVWHQANKLEKVYSNRESTELLSFGFLGLRTALKLYNPDLGFAFSTYACTRITGAIKDGVRAESPIPKRLNTFNRKVIAARSELEIQLNRTPTLQEISEKVGTDLDKLKILPRLVPESSVDAIIEASGAMGSTPSWLVDSANDPSLIIENSAIASIIETAILDLPQEEAEAVRLMVMDQLSPSKIRELTGVSSRQMRIRRDKGLIMLRKSLQPLLENA